MLPGITLTEHQKAIWLEDKLNIRVSDLNISKQVILNNQKGFYFNTKISNLLNTKFFYPTTSYSDWAVNGVLGRGRSFLFTLGYKF
jgi:hypothetical protein